MKRIADESIDFIVTDPPYLINYKTNRRKDKKHDFCTPIANDTNEVMIVDYIAECHRILKPDSAIMIFCNADKIDFFKHEIEKHFKLKNIIIWLKNNHTAGDLEAQLGKQYEMIILANKGRKRFNGKRLTDVWAFNRVVGNSQLHQNQKPVELIERAIKMFSNECDTVFDGFMGSGTTAIACMRTNRNFIGFELDENYFKIANERIQAERSFLSQKE